MRSATAIAARHIVAVMTIGVDGMLDINESHGRAAGDELLRTLAHRLALAVRDGDSVARLSGDEFGVLFDGVDSIDDAISLAHRVREAVSRVAVDTRAGSSTFPPTSGSRSPAPTMFPKTFSPA